MKKYLILCFIFVFTLASVTAQDKDSKQDCKTDSCYVADTFAPQKGDYTAALVFGRGAYLDGGLVVPGSYSSVPGDAAVANDVSTNYNSATNMVGVEARYYASNNFAITLSGGAILRNTPYQLAIPAAGNIPAYDAVVADERADVNVTLGGQWLFKAKNNRMFPYLGFGLPFDYARRSLFDPTVIPEIADLGARHVEIISYGVQAVAGIDYYLAKDVFFGVNINPVSYTYAVSYKSPGPGLLDLDADTDTISFFAQFSLRLGFKF